MERKKQPTESVLSKILLIFASTLVKTGGNLRRATTLLTVSESANSTVKVLEGLRAALSISYIYAPAPLRGRHSYMPYRCGLIFILSFTGIAEPTDEEWSRPTLRVGTYYLKPYIIITWLTNSI